MNAQRRAKVLVREPEQWRVDLTLDNVFGSGHDVHSISPRKIAFELKSANPEYFDVKVEVLEKMVIDWKRRRMN